ncbi:MAG: PAS-domain containing protein [Alphaproteobacteria bacterium]|nr:PAS-domain containing protein [Alphaproteobacteria bacterium]MBT8474935.1 PAS-domain containing protein [Alphaproteobacteria bacterium]
MLTTSIDLLLVLSAGAAAFIASLFALFLGSIFFRKPRETTLDGDQASGVVFLFDGTDLIDATPAAEDILRQAVNGSNDWNRALSILLPRFPGFDTRLSSIDAEGKFTTLSEDGTKTLTAETVGPRLALTLRDVPDAPQRAGIDSLALSAMTDELTTLQTAVRNVPFLIWRQHPDGPVTWANGAYIDAIADILPSEDAHVWPMPTLFDQAQLASVSSSSSISRLALADAGADGPQWFDCAAVEIGEEFLFSAVNVDGTVTSESQRQAFTQTLTQTFSHLTAGLGVFDKDRRLALFNPALTDLTGLPIDFLASRPTLFSVLDRLRDRQMIPEPKDYINWRRHMADLEAAAVDGTYEETWSLPNGRTFRVTGRPHPDGAVAFVLEDISAEMRLTRQFRAELNLGQSVIDSLEDALVVFTPDGELAMANTAYGQLWERDGAETTERQTVTEASRIWMARCVPTPIWGDLRSFVLHESERAPWRTDFKLATGARLECRVQPLSGGSTLVTFCQPSVVRIGAQPSLLPA